MIFPQRIPSLTFILIDFAAGLRDWEYPDCAAPFWRLYWNASGRGVVTYERRETPLEGRTILLIPPETHFRAHAESPMDHLFLHFLAGPPFDAAAPCVVSSEGSPEELGELRGLIEEISRNRGSAGGSSDQADLPFAHGAALGAALGAASLCYKRLAAFPRERLPTETDGVAGRVADYIRSRWSSPPTIDEVAAALGTSVPTLERRIRAAAGKSLHAFGLWVRVNEACIRLRHSDDSVERIGEQLGFADRSHFIRVFTRLRGESPAAYRRSLP
jgi:AraC-like DNA-binding protein